VKIGEVAARAGVTIDTIRFYERRGVLPAAARRPSGYRDYPDSTVARIRMARDLQQLGFSLDEIIDALRAHDAGGVTCASELWRLGAVLDRIDARIADLRRTRRAVVATIADCSAGQCRFAPVASAAGAGRSQAAGSAR
jgi:MerR family transcriptional regulator, copper efflux regulator